jgi:glutamyl-tRNA synthetase
VKQKGHAYRCFCSEERLTELRKGASKKGSPTLYDRYCLTLSQQEIQEKLHNKAPYTIRLKVILTNSM